MIHLYLIGTLVVSLLGAGAWAVSTLRAADRAEIAALQGVAEHNQAVAERQRRQASLASDLADEAAREQAAAHDRLQGRLDELRSATDAKRADAADPCNACRLRWESAEDGDSE